MGVLVVGKFLFRLVVLIPDLGNRVGFVGHQNPIHQVNAADFDVAFLGDAEHQFFESREPELALVEAGDAADQPLLQRGEQEGVPGGSLGANDVLNGADYFGKLVASGVAQLRRGLRPVALVRPAVVLWRFDLDGVNVRVVENQAVHVVGHAAGRGPGNADDQDALADGAQGVDDVDEVGIARYQHEGVDVGEIVGGVDAVGGHLDVDAVFDGDGASGAVGTAGRQAGGHVHRLDAGGVERRGVLDELAGALEFGRASYPVRVSFAYYHPAVVGDFFLEGGDVGGSAPGRQADFEVLPVYE